MDDDVDNDDNDDDDNDDDANDDADRHDVEASPPPLPLFSGGCAERADRMCVVPEGGREALLPLHGLRAQELLQREVLCRLPTGLLQTQQGQPPRIDMCTRFGFI